MLSDAENFECTVCGKCFKNTLDLSRHIEILCKFTLKNKDVIDILNSDHYDLKGATEVLLRHLSLNPVDNYSRVHQNLGSCCPSNRMLHWSL